MVVDHSPDVDLLKDFSESNPFDQAGDWDTVYCMFKIKIKIYKIKLNK